MFRKCSLACVMLLLLVAAALMFAQNSPVGYTDTPMLPGLPYRVHDPARPHPAVVTPAAQPGGAAVGCDRSVRRQGSLAMDSNASAMESRERLYGSCRQCRRSPVEGKVRRRPVACRMGRAGAGSREQSEPRQQRDLSSRTLRSAGSRFLRQSDLRRWTGGRDLWTVAAACERHSQTRRMAELRYRV